jgi:dihydrofolate synthase/folylpolyglutamate synthase
MDDYKNIMVKLYNLNLHTGIKLGLLNSKRLCQTLGSPHNSFSSIHVAGTNGKGSVVTKISKGLEYEGKRVGLYTSPHISCFRERIRINGEMISEQDVGRLINTIFKICDQEKISATFFEVTTFLAFLYFAEQKVDFAVIETGLGGRLDATNVIRPILTIITSISLDHVDILGHTTDQIASEKAGIIKYKVPLIIGPFARQNIITKMARVQESPLLRVDGDFSSFDEENNAISLTALKFLNVSDQSIKTALKVKPPCRCEILVEGKVVLDVAHNPQGLQRLFSTLRKIFPQKKFRIIFGLSKTKDVTNCLEILKTHGKFFHVVEAKNGRGIPSRELKEIMLQKGFNKKLIVPTISIQESVSKALATSTLDEVIVVCGTFFVMSEARKALGINEPCDAFDMNEASSTACH